MPSQHFVPHVFFDLDPMMVSTVVLCVTYGVIIWDKLNRAIVALLGAAFMIIVGALDQNEALKGVDWNTIGLLTGMMILVSISRRSGMFEYLAIWSAQKAKANPAGILLLLQITTAVVSALLDNVTTVLLVVPVTLAITKELDVPPYPFLFAEVFASNIGGTATLIGDPPNILIGSLVGLDFNAFIIHLAPVIVVIMAVQALMIHLLWGRALRSTPARRALVMGMSAKETIVDWTLLKQSLVILTVVIAAFVLARPLHLEPATIAMGGAALLMLLDNWQHHNEKQSANVHKTFGDVEWITIFFFVGLFIVVHGVEVGGLLQLLANALVAGHRRRPGDRRLRHPVGIGLLVGNCRQHSVRGHDDSADQEHGSRFWRHGQDRAAVVVPVARGLPWRQRDPDRRVGQPDGCRHRRAKWRPLPFCDLHPLRHADDDRLDRHQPHLCVVALFLRRPKIRRQAG